MGNAVLIGNSDGIGLSATRALLAREWTVAGLSRSVSPIQNKAYTHTVITVQNKDYTERLKESINRIGPIDLCVYCAGIGELLDLSNMEKDLDVFDVNLIGLVKTVVHMVPHFLNQGSGHFIGLSSLADELLSNKAPSYHASKAGFSSYLESLALALKPKGVYVTNLRFGFVNTKMAKGEVKPFMMDVERAAEHLFNCIQKKPIRYTAPRIVVPLVKFRHFIMRITGY